MARFDRLVLIAAALAFALASTSVTALAADAIRIDSTGKIGINDDTPSYQLDVTGNAHVTSDVFIGDELDVVGSIFTDNRVYSQYLVHSGAPHDVCAEGANGYLYLCSSSMRFKDNIHNYKSGLETVMKLRPVSFNWKEGGAQDVGFLAEEVAKAAPLHASVDKDGQPYSVNYKTLTALLVNAMKEQQRQIDELRNQLRSLRSQTAKAE